MPTCDLMRRSETQFAFVIFLLRLLIYLSLPRVHLGKGSFRPAPTNSRRSCRCFSPGGPRRGPGGARRCRAGGRRSRRGPARPCAPAAGGAAEPGQHHGGAAAAARRHHGAAGLRERHHLRSHYQALRREARLQRRPAEGEHAEEDRWEWEGGGDVCAVATIPLPAPVPRERSPRSPAGAPG